MRAARTILAISLTALALAACDKGDPVAPTGAKLTITANPAQIAANGTSTIRVRAVRASGLPVNPGTEIRLFTTLGTIDEVVTTDDSGFAIAELHGTGQQGTAKVTASSGGAAEATADVVIGQKATTLTLQGAPSSIDPTTTTRVTLTALVRDDRGDPIPDVLVVFTTEAGSLASRGTGVRTNSRGVATDTLTVTAANASAVSDAIITVNATATSGGGTATGQLNLPFRTDGGF
jgi:hypothetical protein